MTSHLPEDLLDAPLDVLMGRARAVRDRVHGTRITYSPKVFLPLTMLCRDRCGYCTFAQPPARLQAPYLTPEQVLRIAGDGARMGCHEALFTLGEAPEDRYEVAREWLREHGYGSTVEYDAVRGDDGRWKATRIVRGAHVEVTDHGRRHQQPQTGYTRSPRR